MAADTDRVDSEANSTEIVSKTAQDDCEAQSSTSENHFPTQSPAYSTFTKAQKWSIIALSTFAASFSPLSSFIFFPAIPALADHLEVSTGMINLTVTSYLIVAGIAPTLLGDLADTSGRRLVYILMMTVYCLANVGLALQSTWAALFVLRMMQSFGSAATIAVGFGVVADIAVPAERGHFVSGLVMGPNIFTAVGPLISGALLSAASWRWIFWFLAILAGICLLLIAFLLPETARGVAGDGSIIISAWRRPVLPLLSPAALGVTRPNESNPLKETRPSQTDATNTSIPSQSRPDAEKGTRTVRRRKFRIPNPTASLKLLRAKDCISVVLIFSIFYMNLSCVQASTSTLFVETYGVSAFGTGLIYLPSGIGSIIGAYGVGFVLTYDYRVVARKHDVSPNEKPDDISCFPIEKARCRSIALPILSTGCATIGYGWALRYRAHMAVPLTLQFIIGFTTAFVFNMAATLLTDIHPKSPSTASAANSIVRCLLAAGGLAIVELCIESIGVEWTFTLLGLICLSALALVWLERRFGMAWRRALREKGMER